MGLVGSEDNVGAIAYAAHADVRFALQRAGGAGSHGALRRSLQDAKRNGITNFAEALDAARAMLEAGKAPRGSPIILLTDGIPYRGRRR